MMSYTLLIESLRQYGIQIGIISCTIACYKLLFAGQAVIEHIEAIGSQTVEIKLLQSFISAHFISS